MYSQYDQLYQQIQKKISQRNTKKKILINKTLNKMMPSQQKDYFGHANQGENYDKFRPTYPQELLDKIRQHIVNKESYLDIACGTGQLLFELESLFQQSVGQDISSKQIDVLKSKITQKKLNHKVHAILSDAHSLSEIINQNNQNNNNNNIPTKYDLITIGQALHWFDTQLFFKEVSDNLINQNPESIFAVTGYFCRGFDFYLNNNHINNNQPEEEIEEDKTIYNDFYNEVKQYFDCDRDNLSNSYIGYDFGKYFNEIDKLEIIHYTPCTVYEMIKYLKTYSAYNAMLELKLNQEGFIDPILNFEKNINDRINQIQLGNQYKLDLPIRMKTTYFLRIFKKIIH